MGSGLTELTCHSSLFVRLHYIVRCKCYFQLFCLPTNEHLRVIILDREHCVRVCCQGSHEDVVWMQVQCKEVCWCLHDEYQLQFKQKLHLVLWIGLVLKKEQHSNNRKDCHGAETGIQLKKNQIKLPLCKRIQLLPNILIRHFKNLFP